MQKEQASKRFMKRPYESVYNLMLDVARRSNTPVDITYEEFICYTKQKTCHYCYSDIVWCKHDRAHAAGGNRYNLDRVNSSQGYEVNNLVVCCKRCNIGKNRLFSYAEWWRMTECFRKEKANVDQQGESDSNGQEGQGGIDFAFGHNVEGGQTESRTVSGEVT
jgi:hypothetical protein